MRILIDANVPLNVWLADRPMSRESALVMQAVGDGKIQGYMTSSLVLFVFIWLQKAHSPAAVERLGKQLLEIITVIPQQKGSFIAGLEDLWADAEDGFQFQAAVRYRPKLDMIVTTNTRHFQRAKDMAVLNPSAFADQYL